MKLLIERARNVVIIATSVSSLKRKHSNATNGVANSAFEQKRRALQLTRRSESFFRGCQERVECRSHRDEIDQ
jgi:hypothetical protein